MRVPPSRWLAGGVGLSCFAQSRNQARPNRAPLRLRSAGQPYPLPLAMLLTYDRAQTAAVTYPDTDAPKGTALMSSWPTLEWPDARQSAIAPEAANVSSATCVAMFGFQGG